MDIVIDMVEIKAIDDIEIYNISVAFEHYLLVKKRLEYEYEMALSILRALKITGEIKRMEIPRNKHLQSKLNRLIESKKIIKKSLSRLKDFYK